MSVRRDRAVLVDATSAPDTRDFVLTLWTDDPVLAASADRAGVDRVGLDLERLGKRARQAGLGTWISTHRLERLGAVRDALARAKLFARVNPVSPRSPFEVERLLECGVEVLMLPMFRSSNEVERFLRTVDGRACVVPLLETPQAAEDVERLASLTEIDEVHVGINDLALSLGVRNRYEVLELSLMEEVSACVRGSSKRLGVGGIGRVDDCSLPIPADLIYAQCARLGATAMLLSRAFIGAGLGDEELAHEIARSRARLADWFATDPAEMRRARAARRLAVRRCRNW
jgi:hypothetical protein